ncbi:MAG: class I SAM-dependent methyltransferase [Candidatus Omnitrophica bacterium]|nr:class I SAM-dependent methyltransferase [Candidatus Omnitrophota bacterium]
MEEYIPEITDNEIKENHAHLSERFSIYKKKGLDVMRVRELILDRLYPLEGGILEIGAGNGYTTLALAKAGYRVVAVDTDREALRTAALNLAYENALSNVRFYVMDGESLAFEDRSFGNVVGVNLFHHLTDAGGVLSEADRVLCAGGRLVSADFNKRGLEVVGSVHTEEGRVHESSGVTQEQVYSCLHDMGYEIEPYDERHHWVLIARK